ncbi:unnamed protein product [Rotaria magnacalcarata]|uniref:DUF427 domain-containing protein n=1 Tax=Rotaria magnacalcarata TaxID=392030 RepID=A0A816PEM2_9BILA|nr:unnamed protein product [Rotaria magnacalcarata]
MSLATARRIPPGLGQESVWDYPRPPLNGKQAENVAWYYSKTTGPEFSSIKDHVALYVGSMDECRVDGERVVSQPGQFYGGWITKDMIGPFKGESAIMEWQFHCLFSEKRNIFFVLSNNSMHIHKDKELNN